MNYDSTAQTQSHIMRVGELISFVVSELLKRASAHDKSKLENPEKEIFDAYTPRLREVTYGSDEYKAFMKEMGIAIQHHHLCNRHHPEFFNGPEWGGNRGIEAMNIVDLVEMICDWVAASERHTDGDPIRSIEINKERFGYSHDLASILTNTVRAIKAGDSTRV